MAIEQLVSRGLVERTGEVVGHGLGRAGHVAADGALKGAKAAVRGLEWADVHGMDKFLTPARTDATAEAIWHGAKGSVQGVTRAAAWVDAHGGSQVLTDERADKLADGIWTGVKTTFSTVVGWMDALDRTAFGRGVGRGLDKAVRR